MEHNRIEDVEIGEKRVQSFKKVSIISLIFFIFYEESGGPFGVEDDVDAASPLLALIGFLAFTIMWSIPEALITVEMGTMFIENGGYVVLVSVASGPYWGFQQCWMIWLSGAIDSALYSAISRLFKIIYPGIYQEVGLGIFSILPSVIMGFISIQKLKPSRWYGRTWNDSATAFTTALIMFRTKESNRAADSVAYLHPTIEFLEVLPSPALVLKTKMQVALSM
ncbi:hypothetical protein GIB67_022169 [Kingdonia uniflora]|uniref:Uncharacterized protein n=1 Tax=Kingdonia uniflora TaxID=39325 RepID=A0A7J7N9A9_9MAGN|nr:hypothetical protein GIB67_022169 [Kingdonia uniflora]